MEVKGTAFLGRKAMLVAEFGEDRFNALLARVASKHPVFTKPILATTSIDFRAFLEFNETVVREFFGGDNKSYWQFGEKSAEWALTQGPYKHLLASKSIDEFAESATRIYKNYFTEGTAASVVRDGEADVTITGVPPQSRHIYMEYSIIGYFRRGLELVGARNVRADRKKGFSVGDDMVLYRYTWDH